MSAARPRHQRGVAAVELALLLPMLLTLLAVMLLFVRAFLSYNIMQNAAHHAARYMASIPPADMGNFTRRTAAVAVARTLVQDAAAAAGLPVFPAPTMIGVFCGAVPCDLDTSTPATVRVLVSSLALPLDVLAGFSGEFGDGGGIHVRLDVTVPYGN